MFCSSTWPSFYFEGVSVFEIRGHPQNFSHYMFLVLKGIVLVGKLAVLRDAVRERCVLACSRVACPLPRRRQTCHFRKRATSAPAEGPTYGLNFARRCEFPLRALQAQKWRVWGSRTFGAAWHCRVGSCGGSSGHTTPESFRAHTSPRRVRPISVLRFWISEGLTQAES